MPKKPGNTRDPLRDCAGTPPDFFAELHAEFGFTVDACALPFNAKLPRYWAPAGVNATLGYDHLSAPAAYDGLAQDWAGERVWCNPPPTAKGLLSPG